MTRKSCVNREPFKTLNKKNVTRDQHLLCTIANETSDIQRFYCYSYFFLTGNDSGVMGFFPENRNQFVEVSAETNGSLIFGILSLFSGGKICHLTI